MADLDRAEQQARRDGAQAGRRVSVVVVMVMTFLPGSVPWRSAAG